MLFETYQTYNLQKLTQRSCTILLRELCHFIISTAFTLPNVCISKPQCKKKASKFGPAKTYFLSF